MSQLPTGTSLSVSTAGPIYPLSWTRISSKKPRPSPGGTACPCASSSKMGLDGWLLGELRFVEIRARLVRGCRALVTADVHYFCLDEMTPGARLVQVDQHLHTVVVAHAGYVGRVALQGRNELPGMIELVEHVIARCRVCAQTGYGASLVDLGVKVVQIRNRFAKVRLVVHRNHLGLSRSNVVSTLISMRERGVMRLTEGSQNPNSNLLFCGFLHDTVVLTAAAP